MSDTYDAGYLPDNENCNQDSIRVELAYSHDFYSSIIESKDERIAELEKESNWVSVEDEWPNPEYGNVLGHNGDYAFECSFDDGYWCNIGGEDFTHWKPLNPPIKEPKEQVK